MVLLKNQYYDEEEGKDYFGKMAVTNQYAAILGLGTATYDVLLYSKPKGFQRIIGRYAFHVGPLMGMASAFTTVTYMGTKLRGKDDRLNYFLGGMAAGGVYGAWSRSFVAGAVVGVFLGAAAFTKKTSFIEGWSFTNPNFHHGYQTLNMQKSDHTVFKDTEKGWAKEC